MLKKITFAGLLFATLFVSTAITFGSTPATDSTPKAPVGRGLCPTRQC